tara:strand:+ start:5998 stop:8595 length:2598 start_codon:yes stop_codon:yes gene_type:complete
MAFDAKTFLAGGGSISNLATSFGIPSCALGLASDVLGLIPTPILLALRQAMVAATQIADAIIKRINSYIRDLLGISLFPNRDGFFGFFSNSSRFGLDLFAGITAAIGAFLAVVGTIQALEAKLEEAKKCMKSFKDYLDFTGGNAAKKREELADLSPEIYKDLIDSQFSVYLDQAQQAQDFIDEANAQIAVIDGILLARTLDPSLEPGEEDEITESVFRLEAGPPKSTSGKFILSVDGLYYDSQTDGIQPALLELAEREEDLKFKERGFTNGDLWKLEFDPSLGGRGIPLTSNDLRYYFNSILDPDQVDNSRTITKYYNQDELLLSLEGQKDRRVFDVSSELQELIDDNSSQAIIDNMRQVMFSDTAQFQDRINKRKKQIELAVKIPTFLGKGPQYTPGNVPVNDFSYLAGSNFLVDIENQRKITLDQTDVTGVVLPLEVKFTEKIETTDTVFLDHILLANVARGETVASPLEPSAASLQITDRIVEDDLFALYNYLSVETDNPSGSNFGNHNSSRLGVDVNSQIVGDFSSIFDRGLGVPFFSGVSFPKEGSSEIESMGSYVKLPENSDFQDFLYNTNGATFESWVHMPDLDGTTYGWNMHDNSTLGLYRLILANENVGLSESKSPQPNINKLQADSSTGIVRGAILGFTRDRRFTLGLDPSNDNGDNDIANLSLVLAPTQSYDSSSAGFITTSQRDCNRTSPYGLTVPVFDTFNGKSLSSCGNSFVQLSVSLDPQKDEVRVYADGVKLMTSSYHDVFPTTRTGQTYKAPSIKQNNSFEYSGGPSLDTYFTPWILGGGYTDGLSAGNFMGGEFGGKVSGLKGYLGCTRFYSKPLDDSEVLNNYKATQNFFKNVEVPNSMWEPLEIP